MEVNFYTDLNVKQLILEFFGGWGLINRTKSGMSPFLQFCMTIHTYYSPYLQIYYYYYRTYNTMKFAGNSQDY